ncbi:MAG TPA: hypothetical protein VF286_05260, partial [Acidiphilium sp.]
MRIGYRTVFLTLAATLAFGTVQGFAATESDAAHQPSAADIAAVRAFRLTPGFLGKWLALAKDPKMP